MRNERSRAAAKTKRWILPFLGKLRRKALGKASRSTHGDDRELEIVGEHMSRRAQNPSQVKIKEDIMARSQR
jgi:hypothetical protein